MANKYDYKVAKRMKVEAAVWHHFTLKKMKSDGVLSNILVCGILNLIVVSKCLKTASC